MADEARQSEEATTGPQSFWEFRKNFKPFTCAECGGNVVLTEGPGRTMELYRGVPELELYEKFPLPTCEECGETYVPAELEDELEDHLRGRFDLLVWKRLSALEELVLTQCVLSSFWQCESCGYPATRCLSRGRQINQHVCDRCHKGEPSVDLKQAPLIRELARLRGDGG